MAASAKRRSMGAVCRRLAGGRPELPGRGISITSKTGRNSPAFCSTRKPHADTQASFHPGAGPRKKRRARPRRPLRAAPAIHSRDRLTVGTDRRSSVVLGAPSGPRLPTASGRYASVDKKQRLRCRPASLRPGPEFGRLRRKQRRAKATPRLQCFFPSPLQFRRCRRRGRLADPATTCRNCGVASRRGHSAHSRVLL